MNTTVWLINFTRRNGGADVVVHTHNAIADYRTIDQHATVREIDVAAVAELIERLRASNWRLENLLAMMPADRPERAALARIGGAA